jgi:hypothetical protein
MVHEQELSIITKTPRRNYLKRLQQKRSQMYVNCALLGVTKVLTHIYLCICLYI